LLPMHSTESCDLIDHFELLASISPSSCFGRLVGRP
jgi:hypothetical protein